MTTRPIAMITGASRGIGQKTALSLANSYDLIIHASKLESLANTKALVLEQVPECTVTTMAFDIGDEKSIAEHTKSIQSLDVLVNNAGVLRTGGLDSTEEDFLLQFRVNVMGLWVLTKELAPKMKHSSNPYIFNLSSLAGVRPVPRMGIYSATKYMVTGFGANFMRELLDDDIRMTTLCPSVIDTDMTQGFNLPNEDKIQTEDIANAILFCLNLSKAAIVERLEIACKKVLQA